MRLSGPEAASIARELFRPGVAGTNGPGRAVFGRLTDRAGASLDQGYLVLFAPPRSFTGEPTAELWAHGSPAVLRRLTEEAVAAGARPATPGEFTLRAFLNGRIDVTQAEAIRDLIQARTIYQARVAHEQATGRISAAVNRFKSDLSEIIARVEASIEFSEEAEAERFLPGGPPLGAVRDLRSGIEMLAGTFERGRRVRDGATVALVGSPNVGKSSLFNRLLEENRAIVTPAAGTTRDLLEETIDLNGMPVTLIDTAGMQAASGEADVEAVRRARATLDSADLLLIVLDWSRPINEDERALLNGRDDGRSLVVLNKVDLACGVGLDRVLHLRKRHGALEASARSGEGIGALRSVLGEKVGSGDAPEADGTFVTNLRHRDLLLKSAGALARAEGAARDNMGEECLVLDLRAALDHLGEITGEVGIDSIYERIFRNFCIGK